MRQYASKASRCKTRVEPGRVPRGGRPHARRTRSTTTPTCSPSGTASTPRRPTSSAARNAAQTLANSLEILGRRAAHPGQLRPGPQHLQRDGGHRTAAGRRTQDRRRGTLRLRHAETARRTARAPAPTGIRAGPRPPRRRRCRADRPPAPAPAPARPSGRAPPRRRRAPSPPSPCRTKPISVGPAPDQLAASAPASTSASSSPGASGNSAVRAGWWMRSSVAAA